MELIRLQKYLAESSVASRRKSEELIKQGRVSVNDLIITEMGVKISSVDIVKVDGKPVNSNDEKIYILLNKPVGYITTVKDQFSRKTVIDLVKKDIKERVYPVGRLDYDTSGLIILTNDGEFTYRLTHPKHEIDKVYLAEVIGVPDESDIKKFAKGIILDDLMTSPAAMKLIKSNKEKSVIEITIHEGKNRQIRRMCESIGHQVIKLKRIAIGKVKIGDLEEGKWRILSREEKKWLNL